MRVTLDIPDRIADKAQAEGVPVEVYLRHLVELDLSGVTERHAIVSGVPAMSPAEAGADILEMRKRYTLAGIKIKDLIEEGRRY